MMTRVETLNAIAAKQKELARDGVDGRDNKFRARGSRYAHLVNKARERVYNLSEATTPSLALFLEHLEGVRPRVEAERRADDLLASIEMTPTMVKKFEKALKGAKK